MIVVVKTPNDKQLAGDDYRDSLTIEVDGNRGASFWDGEPEDNTIGRNFNDVVNIPNLMKLAYEAGLRGETFSIEYMDND